MIICIPNNNLNERKYIIDILCNEFLGLTYIIEIKDIQNYEIVLENENKLIIEDHFFNKFSKDLDYLKLENIPQKVKFTKNDYIVENNIPVIYGTTKLETLNHKSKTIICGIDIFASSFFMLTRWEEYVNENRDTHNRFPASESLAFKSNFLDRPIVNEYVEMIWNMFVYIGINQKQKSRNYQLFLTHDVDSLYFWKSYAQLVKTVLGDIVKRKNIKLAIQNIKEYILIKLKKMKDPFDTFEWIMDQSDTIGVKSCFYFMSGGVTTYDNNYKIDEKRSLELIEKIKKRGHIIGIHPSYNAYNDFNQLKKEKDLLESITKQPIVEGREHYLRFEVPTTWQIWEDNGLKVDSTCGYAAKEGFRCGTAHEFSVFNILTRKQLHLKERPLIMMETSFKSYQSDVKPSEMYDIIFALMTRVKKGEFTILWHNSNFNTEKYQHVYEKIIKQSTAHTAD